jgi:hypothetical protein
MMNGSIYFLQVGADGPIKIGFTISDVKRRVRAHQTGSPHILRWIGVYEGSRQDELHAHRLLQNSSLRGEWFYPTTEVLAFVRQQSPDFQPLIVENVLFKPHSTGRGSGRRMMCVARPERSHG